MGINRRRSQEGSAMSFALLILIVVSVAGVFLTQVAAMQIKQAGRGMDKLKAHYYAKSGVEMAVGLIKSQGQDAFPVGHEITYYGDLESGEFASNADRKRNYSIAFAVTIEDDDMVSITSAGIIRDKSDSQRIAEQETISFDVPLQYILDQIGGGDTGEFLALFIKEQLALTGSSNISGAVVTMADRSGSVSLTGNPRINGDIYVSPNAEDPQQVVNEPRFVTGKVNHFASVRDYGLPVFPDFPSNLPTMGDLTADWYPIPEGGWTIDSSGYYDTITVKQILTINVGDSDLLLRIKDLRVEGSGQIVINRMGQGRVVMFIEDQFELVGGTAINSLGSRDDLNVFYDGTRTVDLAGDVELVGNLYARNADVRLGGSGGLKGDLICGGTHVEIDGAADAISRVIYAPNAAVTMGGSGTLRGTVVAKQASLVGNASIDSSSELDTSFFDGLDWDNLGRPSISTGEYEPIIRYVWQERGTWRTSQLEI